MRTATVVALVMLAACSSADSEALAPDAAAGTTVPDARADASAFTDDDGDGLDDAYETALAEGYLPFISLDPEDGCPRSGLVARVRKHPADATKILIVYAHLFERDCGINGHVGDNEAFGIAIDPALAAPAGILAIRTASHQNTPCERITECTTCSGDGRVACDRQDDGGVSWPVLYASRGKHGQYASSGQCPFLGTCFDLCTLNTERTRPPLVNAGEPGAPLAVDLTTDGFVNAAHGWSEAALMNIDPWDPGRDFGSAGNIAGDLVDPTFAPAPCGP